MLLDTISINSNALLRIRSLSDLLYQSCLVGNDIKLMLLYFVRILHTWPYWIKDLAMIKSKLGTFNEKRRAIPAPITALLFFLIFMFVVMQIASQGISRIFPDTIFIKLLLKLL
ncbi:membrane protein [Shigella phage vB_SdyM_006]|nr:membrane protein [Shigella phage vB_SdyM_006]